MIFQKNMMLTITMIFASIFSVNSKSAYCILKEDMNSGIHGYVKFEQTDQDHETQISARVYGLKPGNFHGFHIHEKNDFTNGCISAGPHYNPHGKDHGSPLSQTRHVGDMGNLRGKEGDLTETSFRDRLISLYGEYTIINRACMIHEKADDLGKGDKDSKTTGNAGARFACGAVVEGEIPPEYLKILDETKDNSSFIWKFVIVIGAGIAFYYVGRKIKGGYKKFEDTD